MPETFVRLTRIEASPEEVFDWLSRPAALARISPPWLNLEWPDLPPTLRNGERLAFRLRWGPIKTEVKLERQEYSPHQSFADRLVKSPFPSWTHRHLIEPDRAASFVEDRIEYEIPKGPWSQHWFDNRIRRELERWFLYYYRVLARDLAVHRSYHIGKPLKIVVTGATGFVGSNLCTFLRSGGHTVVPVTRRTPPPPGFISWDFSSPPTSPEFLEDADAVVHLAGEPILQLPWTKQQRERILTSRVVSTRMLSETLRQLRHPPRVFITASAVGYYGDRGPELLDEESPRGNSFLSEVCDEWEKATAAAQEAGVRVAHLRFGMILSPRGGILRPLVALTGLNLSPIFGDGYQYLSWVTMDDALEAIYHVILTPSLSGPINITAPQPVTQRDFVKILARVMNRATWLRLPAGLLYLGARGFAKEVLLASARVIPQKLLGSHFSFQFTQLEPALSHLLGLA